MVEDFDSYQPFTVTNKQTVTWQMCTIEDSAFIVTMVSIIVINVINWILTLIPIVIIMVLGLMNIQFSFLCPHFYQSCMKIWQLTADFSGFYSHFVEEIVMTVTFSRWLLLSLVLLNSCRKTSELAKKSSVFLINFSLWLCKFLMTQSSEAYKLAYCMNLYKGHWVSVLSFTYQVLALVPVLLSLWSFIQRLLVSVQSVRINLILISFLAWSTKLKAIPIDSSKTERMIQNVILGYWTRKRTVVLFLSTLLSPKYCSYWQETGICDCF